MKKNKLLKTGALALGTVASVAAPIAAVVSCGSSTDNSESVVIKYTWAANGPQIKALQPVVDYYNKHVKAAGDFNVKLAHVEGGYGKAVELDRMDIAMNNMDQVADVIIDYPDSLGVISTKALDFGSSIKGDFDKDEYVTSSLEGMPEGVYSLPLAKSTEMLSIDIPFMKALEKGGVIDITGTTKLKESVGAYDETANSAEIKAITDKIKIKSSASAIVVTDADLEDYNKLFDLGDKISQALDYSHGKSSKIHIIGEDAPTNLVYQLFNAKQGYDMDKFMFHKETGSTKFDYGTFKDGTKDGGKVLKEIIGDLNNHVGTGSLVMNGGGAYSSSDFMNHDLPFIIGSTAGFDHNSKDIAKFGIKPSSGDVVPLSGYNKEIVAPTDALRAKGAIAMTTDKYHNGVYQIGNDHTGANHEIVVSKEEAGKITAALTGGEEIVLKEGKGPDYPALKAAAQTAIENYAAAAGTSLDKINAAFTKKAGIALKEGSTPANILADIIAAAGKTAGNPDESALQTALENLFPSLGLQALSGTYYYDVVTGEKTTLAGSKDSAHVNANEILSLGAPVYSDNTGTQRKQIISQGPSFIGVKHGGKKDEQTIKFMNWFFGKTSQVKGTDGNSVSPVDMFDEASGYITPVNGAFDSGNRAKYTKGNLVAFDAFASLGTDGIPFDNPVTQHSSDVRKNIETELQAMYTDYNGQGSTDSVDDIYSGLFKALAMKLGN